MFTIFLFCAVIAYCVFGGADFGAGFWDLFAGGAERGERPREVIDHSIGPVWEANHVWLIVAVVILFTGFPRAFAAVSTFLHVPLLLALVLFLVAYYGLFASVMGGMAVALDTTAGERERQSLEPLLATPARPSEIVIGKWLAVCAFDALVVTLTLAGFYLTLAYAPLPAVGVPFLFGGREFGRFLLVLLPLMLLLPAILLYVGSRARAYKEAQANVSVLLFVVSLIPVVQPFLQRREPDWLMFVPISAQYSLLSTALRGEAPALSQWLVSWITPTLLAALALVAVARRLGRESILSSR